MKSTLNILMMTVAALALTATPSCSSSDDEPSGPVNPEDITSSAIINTNDGEKLLLSELGNWLSFTYTDNGMPLSIGSYTIDYSNCTIMYISKYETEGPYKFSMNKQGYITEMNYEYKSNEEEETHKAKYSYNGKGLITKVVADYKTLSLTYTFSYTGEKLTGVELTFSPGKNRKTYTISESIDNPLRQHTISLYDILDTEMCDNIYFGGFYGKAPANIPTKVVVVETEDDESWTETHNYTYTFNDNGTIDTENSYKYSYIPLGSNGSRAIFGSSSSISEIISHSLAKGHRAHKNKNR